MNKERPADPNPGTPPPRAPIRERKRRRASSTAFSNTCAARALVTIHLMSGAKLTDRIKSFDRYSLVFEPEGQDQFIFKHTIATVVAGKGAGAGGPRG